MRRAARRARAWALFVGAALAATAADVALACPVCYGDSDSPMARGSEASILFLAVVTYAVIVGGGLAFVLVRRQALRRAREAAGTPREAPLHADRRLSA